MSLGTPTTTLFMALSLKKIKMLNKNLAKIYFLHTSETTGKIKKHHNQENEALKLIS